MAHKMTRARPRGTIPFLLIILLLGGWLETAASAAGPDPGASEKTQSEENSSVGRYYDPVAGMTADEAVARALERNGELRAARAEVEAARALVRQAGFKANPKLAVGGTRQVGGTDNGVMAEAMLPLELGGRRAARVLVAEREVELRERMVADRERMIAAEVRAKFGETLAEILKLGSTEDLLRNSRQGQALVVERVSEGRSAPLEQNMVLVEVNRLRSLREAGEGRAEVALLELRNLIGLEPAAPLRLRGDFQQMTEAAAPLAEATAQALAARPDLLAARAVEALAEARLGEARAAGRLDAEVRAGYQRMRSGFMVNGIDDAGRLRPIEDVFHSVTFGITLDLPVRNKNQGAIEAALGEMEAAKRRREYLELTVRREVAAAYARHERAARSLEIYRAGVRGQADENLAVVRQTYELGAKTLLDYIAEQRRYIELEADYINAILDTYLARVEIARASAAPGLVKR